MAAIRKTIDPEKNLTTLTFREKTAGHEIMAALMEYYASNPTLFVLWDFTDADVSEVSPSDLERLLKSALPFKDIRKGGKTAVVAAKDIAYGMGRILDALVEISSYPVAYRVFRRAEDALKWLMKPEAKRAS